MQQLSQAPTDHSFVQDPYPFYAKARSLGGPFYWEEYDLICAADFAKVQALLKDRRLGREAPPGALPPPPQRLQPFYDIEANSMLELEPPRHTRLRGLVLRAFTSRRVQALEPGITTIAKDLITSFPSGPFDLLDAYCRPLPVRVIAALLGVPAEACPQLLDWSNAMVRMYMAGRSRADEDAAVAASLAFTAFLRDQIARKRRAPADDLMSDLIAVEDITEPELITTCILLLNAGHEATVHTLGNGVRAMAGAPPPITAEVVEEVLRFDPPLHMFTRWVYDPVRLGDTVLEPGQQVGCLLAAAGRDPARWDDPDRFDPTRPIQTNVAFGAGLHFCVGAPLARVELMQGWHQLFTAHPDLRIVGRPSYADIYHFHGLTALTVTM